MSYKPVDNPYLAHLPPSQRGAGPSVSDPSVREPLYGFIPRKVTGRQVLQAMVCFSLFPQTGCRADATQKDGGVNPFTKQPHSAQYKKILESRKKLPVFNQMDEFMKIVSPGILNLEEGFEFAILVMGPPSSARI